MRWLDHCHPLSQAPFINLPHYTQDKRLKSILTVLGLNPAYWLRKQDLSIHCAMASQALPSKLVYNIIDQQSHSLSFFQLEVIFFILSPRLSARVVTWGLNSTIFFLSTRWSQTRKLFFVFSSNSKKRLENFWMLLVLRPEYKTAAFCKTWMTICGP